MKFRKAFMVICLIICLFTMASACACDANDNATITAIDLDDNHVIDETKVIFDDSINNHSLNELKEDDVKISEQELGAYDENQLGADLRANVIPINVSVEDNTLFVIDCAYDFKGNVSINAGSDLLYNGSVKSLIDVGKMHAGDYTATAVFYGDSNYDELTLNDINFTVSRVTPAIDVIIEDATYPRTVVAIINLDNNANGTVNITINGRTFEGNVVNGNASVDLKRLSAGYKEALIEFFSDDDYNNDVRTNAKFIIYPNNSLIEIKCADTYRVDGDMEMEIISRNSTGDINIYLNGNSYTILYGSSHTIDFSGLGEGKYTVTVILDGDENYTGYSTSTSFKVVKNDLSINLNAVGPITVDSSVKFTAELNESVSGDVVFNINGENYTVHVSNSNVASCSYIPENNQTLTVFATFMGNDKYYANSTALKDFEVERINTTIDVSFYSPITAGGDVRILINMNENVNGFVELKSNDKIYNVAIAEGMGEILFQNLANDTFNISATFYGDERYKPSTSETKQLYVNKIITNMSISINKKSMSYNDIALITINLNENINAIVTVKVNGQNHTVGLVNGKGTFELYKLKVGNYIINAVFAGDDEYVECTSNPLNLTVTGDNITTPVIMDINKDSVFVGDKLIIKLNLNPTVDDIVKLHIGSQSYSVVIDGGSGSFTIDNLANGTYNVWAEFDGNNQHLSNSSDVKQVIVNKVPTDLSVFIDKSSAFAGDNVVVSVKLNHSVTGILKLNIGSDSYDVIVVNGAGNLTIYNLVKGTYNVQAIFDGDDKYLADVSDIKQLQVNNVPTNVSVSLDNDSVFVGDSVVVSVVLNQSINNVVTVNVNDKNYIIGIVNGKGNLTLTDLTYGTYNVNAVFAGDGKYLGCVSSNVTFDVNKYKTVLSANAVVATYNVAEYLTVSLKDSNGKAISNVEVTVDLNGVKTLKTDNNGQFKVSTNALAPNTYAAKIIFNGNDVYEGSVKDVSVTVKKANPKIIAGAKTFKVKVKTKKYSVTLNNNVGKAIGSAKVFLKVNGKTYQATTNANGKATFKIKNLKKKGTYNGVITYNGNAFYNKVSKNIKIKVK